MAEVLITLGVIGIVAAMTLPAVINNSRNKQLEAGLKRSYSVISQALDMYQAETGERITSQNIGYRKLKQILLEYLKTAGGMKVRVQLRISQTTPVLNIIKIQAKTIQLTKII